MRDPYQCNDDVNELDREIVCPSAVRKKAPKKRVSCLIHAFRLNETRRKSHVEVLVPRVLGGASNERFCPGNFGRFL